MAEFPKLIACATNPAEGRRKAADYAAMLCACGLQHQFCIELIPPRKGRIGFRIHLCLTNPPEHDEEEGDDPIDPIQT